MMNRYRKAIVALVGAAVIAIGIWRGETSDEFQILVTVLTALGVYQVPNAT